MPTTTARGPVRTRPTRARRRAEHPRTPQPRWTSCRGPHSAKDPDKGTTTTAYDDAGQLLSTTDARGKTLSYTYDELGRKTRLSNGATKLATWVYDTLSKGLLTSSSRWSGANEYKTATTAYDAAGRPLKHSVTIPTTETGLAGTYTTEYTYTPGGQVATLKYPKLSTPVSGTATTVLDTETVTTEYDELDQAKLMTAGLGWGVYVAQARYSEYGQPLMMDLGGGYAQMVSYDYETGTRRLAHSWLVRENITGNSQDVTYKYDDAGNVSHVFDTGTAGKDYQCFEYDGLRRLTDAWTPKLANCSTTPTAATLGGGAPYWTSYTYDEIGNRLNYTAHTTSGDAITTYTHPISGQGAVRPHSTTKTVTTGTASATNSYTFDAAGNMQTRVTPAGTQTLTWNAEGNLTALADTAAVNDNDSYLYTADGDRLIRKDGTKKTLYLPGQELTYASATTVGTAVRYYSFAGKTVGSRTGSGASAARVLIGDSQNTANLSISSSSNTLTKRYLDPFGNTRGTTAAWQGDHTFLNKPTDTTGLTQVGARYYDTKLGTFISVDPLLDLADPQQWNGYAYANNNPTTWSDPTGLIVNLPRPDWDTPPGSRRPSAPTPAPPAPPVSTTPWMPSPTSSRRLDSPAGRAAAMSFGLMTEWMQSSEGRTLATYGPPNANRINSMLAAAMDVKRDGGISSWLRAIGQLPITAGDGQAAGVIQTIRTQFPDRGPWDAKVALGKEFNVVDKQSSWLDMGDGRQANYDIFGNVIYGYMLAYSGVTVDNAIGAANLDIEGTGVADTRDDISIILGYELASTDPRDLTSTSFYTFLFSDNCDRLLAAGAVK